MCYLDGHYIAHTKCKQCYSCGAIKQLEKVTLQLTFSNIYTYCSNDKCFRLMVRTGIYPYECMTPWDRSLLLLKGVFNTLLHGIKAIHPLTRIKFTRT